MPKKAAAASVDIPQPIKVGSPLYRVIVMVAQRMAERVLSKATSNIGQSESSLSDGSVAGLPTPQISPSAADPSTGPTVREQPPEATLL